MPSTLLPNLATLLGLIPALLGLKFLLNPRSVIAELGVPEPTSPSALALTDTLTQVYATRNIVVALTLLAIRLRGDRKLLGIAMLVGSFMPLMDGLAMKMNLDEGEWKHLPLVPVMLGLGVGLLR